MHYYTNVHIQNKTYPNINKDIHSKSGIYTPIASHKFLPSYTAEKIHTTKILKSRHSHCKHKNTSVYFLV